MENTEATHTTPRKGRTSGLFLTPTHVGLAVGVAVVGCITAFGAGVILGMWYTASEQITPYIVAESKVEERPSSAPVASDARQDNLPVTFYSALVHNDGQHEGVLAPEVPKKPGDIAQKKGQDGALKTPPPTGTAAVAEAVTPLPTPPHETPPATVATAPAVPSTPPPAPAPQHEAAVAATPAPGAAAPTGRRESQTAEAATPATAPAPAARRETAPVVTATAKPTAMPTPPARHETTPVVAAAVVPPTPTPRPTAPEVPARTGVETTAAPSSVPKRGAHKAFSVQVGSFRSQEHATRLLSKLIQQGYQAQITTFTGPGGDAWYRVRIGNFADRSAATQTAQQLKTQNQGSTIVAVD